MHHAQILSNMNISELLASPVWQEGAATIKLLVREVLAKYLVDLFYFDTLFLGAVSSQDPRIDC